MEDKIMSIAQQHVPEVKWKDVIKSACTDGFFIRGVYSGNQISCCVDTPIDATRIRDHIRAVIFNSDKEI